MFLKKRKRSQIITGLDIGTTKVCTIIGKVDEEGSLTILGMGSCPSKGLQRGEIIDIQATVDAIGAQRDFWLAEADLQWVLQGGEPDSFVSLGGAGGDAPTAAAH